MRITAHILRKNRSIESLTVNADKGFFVWKGGTYNIIGKAVNITADMNGISSSPEAYYYEDRPNPISIEEIDPSKTLDEIVLVNALEALAGKPSEALSLVLDYLKSPVKLFLLGFLIIIMVSFFQGLL